MMFEDILHYLVFTACTFLLLFYEVRCRCRGRSSPHAANYSNTVLRERGETDALTLTNLYALELLKPTKSELKQKTGFYFIYNYIIIT